MTDFLRINGVPVGVRIESASVRPVDVGESGRSVDASMFLQRTAVKHEYDGTTPPLTAQEALALEGLLLGLGHVWPVSAERGLYSSRGALLTSSGAAITRSAAFGKFGSDSAQVPNGVTLRTNVLYATGAADQLEPTLSFWLSLDGSTWTHRAYRAAASQWYTDGVASVAPTGVSASYSGTYGWQLVNATGGSIWVDDLWVCPYDWPATWPALVTAYASPVGLAPKLKADGLLIKSNHSIDAFGSVSSMPLLAGVVGSFAANLHTVSFTLMEV